MQKVVAFTLGLVVVLAAWWLVALDESTPGHQAPTDADVATLTPAAGNEAPAAAKPPSLPVPNSPEHARADSESPSAATTPSSVAVAPSTLTRRPRWGVEESPSLPDPSEEDSPMVWAVDRDGIQGAIGSQMEAITTCYDGWLKAQPELTGRVSIRFTIAANEAEAGLASVVKADVLDTELDHVWMEGCVLNTLDELVFERPSDGTINVTYPFVFEAGADEGEAP